ncbi:MAG TPA: Ig-like domain-containing protein [Bryobacteraceae bacterium]|jgi:uncharacterized repeat protein (TIGR01451 family)
MNNSLSCHPKPVSFPGKWGGVIAILPIALLLAGEAAAQSTFGGNAQHTANYTPQAQSLNTVHWSTAIDLNNTGGYAHYGAPLITPANTIFVPVKTGATDGFKVNVFHAATGAAMYSLSTDYVQPSHNWILPYQPVLATNSVETRLYYPGAGGTVYYINNVDSTSHGTPVQQAFYGLSSYQANAAGFNSTVFIDTPITADSSGNIFFGFRVDGTAPAPLGTTQSGFARIDPNGNATYVLAGTAAGDSNIGRDTHNCAPALSNDQSTVYVAVKSPNTESYGYLLGLNATTLATKYKVFLHDPRSNNANNATILDDSTASPMVGPDGDVYFGIFGNPANGSRGFMLHFSADLTTEKPPGGFGWDNTLAVVPASMVPSYSGPSSYLLFSKYNNYANAGNDSADGINRAALLDPNATEVDAHASSSGMLIMREVLTVIGPTADKENVSSTLPYAVREWCINTAAVNPATGSVYFPSEDGHIYGWNLATNSLSQFVQLNAGIGLPYVPSVIGPDGQVYTLNGGTLSAIGSVSGVGIGVTSTVPDVRSAVTGQQITFTVAVSNTGTSGATPTGTVTVTDTTYSVPSPGVLSSSTATLVANIALDGTGHASVSTSALTGTKHFITASYSGDSIFAPGSSSMIEFVHASGSTTKLTSSANPSTPGQAVTFTATVAALPPGSGTPTGQVTFQDGTTVLAQAPLNSSGVVSFTTASLSSGSHTVTATYASDTNFAASSGSIVQSVGTSGNSTTTAVSASPNPSVFGQVVTFTSATTSSGGVPVGTVTFTEGSTVWASSVPVDGSGRASFSTSTLAVTSHIITASFTGASGWSNSSGNSAPEVVNAAATSVALTSSANPSVYSQPVTFSATVTATAPGTGVPAGVVTFKNGNSTLGTGTLNGSGIATFTTSSLAVGPDSIMAVYSGSTSYNGSTSSALSQTVNTDGASTAVSSSVNPSVYGQSVTLTATVTATAPGTGTPTGTVTFNNGTATLGTSTLNGSRQATLTVSTLAVGGASITASYNGDGNFSASTSGVLSQTVNKDGSTASLSSSANPSVFGQPVTFTATIAASAPGSGLPTGTVTFSYGSTNLGSSAVDGAGHATLTTSALPLGSDSITASYGGDSNFNASTSAILTQIVNGSGTTTTVTSSSNPSVFSQPVTFGATVAPTSGTGTPTGTVTFKSGSTTLGSSSLVSGHATLPYSGLAVGTASITAIYSGDSNFSASTSAALSQTVHPAGTSTTVTSSMNPSAHNQSVTFTATVAVTAPGTAAPTGTVTFKDGSRTLGTSSLTGGQATFTISNLNKGTHQITAVYGGTTSFLTSTSTALAQAVN